METLKIALDWTPNVNHLGFFIAQEKGFYHELGLTVSFLNPQEDDYQITPGKKLELGLADLALAPLETVISLNNKSNRVDAIAVYALLQSDLSSITTLASSGINSPRELVGKTYASYKARYEDTIVQELVRHDGGQGDFTVSYPEKLGIWNTLLEGKADATWIFDNWEGVEAASRGIALQSFQLAAYGIPYGYSPVLIAKKEQLDANKAVYKKCIAATQKGYAFAQTHPEEATAILKNLVSERDRTHIDLAQTLAVTAPHFGENGQHGFMEPERVHAFLHWLVNHELEKEVILNQTLFTNELLS
ncbi:MAG: ABC transporter substrate-binding protein [Flavobacterium sp.]|jgi:ABC-type nitrate/sulfonate/bicarbonate transport system substrate-binding protein|uniref:ABC transporter substrate-binding protein n=1 Tax=Flavobacterium sp. TaxID=239 RepID=UPI0022BD47CF|nr:ABC transporter substrate-binding protein [Flavobacterium sp.]MCZ8169468.1 ABC transporter substrate-binding protein [Flavobacterium sp.]MCZ8298219.1 ABC transporter substrate-binding protein [Flavobacterium sp.]